MSIAIQGHPTRGNEVIQILKDLGGINRMNHSGRYANYFYYISGDDNTIAWTEVRPQHLGVFTLEEFGKKFPFKVGETVITTLNHVGTIIGIVNGKYKVLFREDSALIAPRRLKLYKEMKEERNITLTLDKAKEWYNKGGELREIALQAFSEKELNPLPRSWEEFCINYHIKKGECWVGATDCSCNQNTRIFKNWTPSKESAEAHLAMIQLEQLRNCWWNGWEPEWNNSEKHVIKWEKDSLIVFTARRVHAFLVFPTREMAEEFLECFRDLIEKAEDLI